MNLAGQLATMPQGPEFITVILDILFSLAIPNGQYTVFDPAKGIAIVQPVMREGSRTFFRDTPIKGPTSFEDLKRKAYEYERPRQAHGYVVVSQLTDGSQKATLNIQSGAGGGFAETKYYTEVQITFLEDDLSVLGRQDGSVLKAVHFMNDGRKSLQERGIAPFMLASQVLVGMKRRKPSLARRRQ